MAKNSRSERWRRELRSLHSETRAGSRAAPPLFTRRKARFYIERHMENIFAAEGWFVLHLFYRIDRRQWEGLEASSRRQALQRFQKIFEDFGRLKDCQIHAYAVLGHKADMAVMMVGPEFQHINAAENDLMNAFPGGVLQPTYSFLSMSEVSEFLSQEKDYDQVLREKENLSPESAEYQQKMEAFRKRMRSYIEERLFPKIPAHKVMCFYPMSKSRGEIKNWFQLDFQTRKELMASHAISGRKYAGKVQQLVTGSAGLDAWEWGVTLFADDPYYLKRIVYEMRFDEVSAVYGLFGDFLVGIHLPVPELMSRLGL